MICIAGSHVHAVYICSNDSKLPGVRLPIIAMPIGSYQHEGIIIGAKLVYSGRRYGGTEVDV